MHQQKQRILSGKKQEKKEDEHEYKQWLEKQKSGGLNNWLNKFSLESP